MWMWTIWPSCLATRSDSHRSVHWDMGVQRTTLARSGVVVLGAFGVSRKCPRTRPPCAVWLAAVSTPVGRLQLLQLSNDLRWPRTISECGGSVRVPQNAVLVDDKRRRTIADLRVDTHLKSNPVRCTNRLRRVQQQRIVHIRCLESRLLQQILGRPRFVWVDRQ